MKKLPLARSKDIVIQALGQETLIYDLTTHKAYRLNETSTIVYEACNGKTAFAELRIKNNLTDDIIFLALDELKKENLLEEKPAYNSPFGGVARREVIKKVGLASMIALPAIAALVAPEAVDAQSAVCANSCTCSTGNILSGAPAACRATLGGTSNCPNRLTCDCLIPGGIGLTSGTCTGT